MAIFDYNLDNDGEVVVQYIYTLGAAGERLSVAELDRTFEYTYDNLYRLTGETITEGENITVYTYAYDSVGNRILKTKNGAETEYSYNELNQLVADSDNTYEYDLNGNLVRVIGGAQAALYEYNSANKLVKATVQQGINVVEESYTYDYAGNRTSKTTRTSDGNFEVVKYLNDNSSLTNVLAELDFEGNVQAYYTIGADLISQERDGRTYTYLYDGHGSVVGLMNEGGSVTDTYTYDAFGNLLKSTGRTANNYRYCGEQFDSTTGLYYLRARYMDTSTGRFISQDSYAGSAYDPVSLHKYLYANSNPVMYSDPSGYFSLGELSVCSAISSALDTISSNFAMAVWVSFIGGFIAVGDQLSTGNLNPKDLLAEFGKGFIAGFAFSLLSMFLPVKLMMAISGLGIIGGFAGAVKSFSDGEFWQGVYRTSLSTLGGVAWWRSYGNTINEWSKNLFETGKSDTRIKTEQALKGLDKFGDNDLDLGLQPQLQEFKQNGGKGYGEFQSNSSNFCGHIYDAMLQADKIRFNLDEIDFSKVNSYHGEITEFGEPISGNYTNYELWLIKNNPDFLNKTTFYKNGDVADPPNYFK